MKYSSIPLAQTVVAQCKKNGISNIVISPGSRNAPLTISFSEDSFFTCYSIVDERCAAFFALGMAQNLKKPVAVVCTSGSALLNYYPAVTEAFYSEIPLVVISADRPSYKIDVGDGQTIRQDDVFHRHIGYSANLKQDVSHATDRILRYRPQWLEDKEINALQEQIQGFNDVELQRALQVAQQEFLPIHINVPFEEPLYNFVDEATVSPISDFLPEKKRCAIALDSFKEIWRNASRKMVLVGVNDPDLVEQGLLDALASDPSVMVFTECTSNLHHPNFFNSIDALVAPIELSENKGALFRSLQPEILLTFGGLIVSKKIKAFLREYGPKYHWHVGEKRANDTFFCLDSHIKRPINSVLSEFYSEHNYQESTYFAFWNTIRLGYLEKRTTYLKQVPFSDFTVFNSVLSHIPGKYQLQLANSSTVRYAQLFDIDESVQVFCNRGTSGIDGSTSTAIGASMYNKNPTLLITGDLSFFYDSNALWNNYIRKDFRIILVNNSGGGIFRILPGKEDSENFERFFETKHELNASALCKMFGFDYRSAADDTSLQEGLTGFFEGSETPILLEIHTPRLLNNKILMDYFHFIS
ncbi:2-succinyl-5-enolpyruvyl-6-hydroxy-3-cyclohexene-1-carboxylic-acid synthase [Maribacter chungangensis]|uniref:2-succinyl-5-enolpyruvyl-6-hydroxy-3-cyclohexene-1-carboxylate synthase n=1 Tax=Maribacter chungangensis TaxID=1069117 RepID=A0ABW3B2Y7_9FLAO